MADAHTTVPIVQRHSADRKTRYRDEYEWLNSIKLSLGGRAVK
jgi:hypothetical protein